METWKNGECLSCSRIATCRETSLQRVLANYRCQLFLPVEEAVFEARLDSMSVYGPRVAVQAMMEMRPEKEHEGDENE